MTHHFLDTSIEYLKGVGPKRGDFLKKEFGIYCFGDLLNFFPYRYIDRSKFHKVSEITSDSAYIQLKGKIRNLQQIGKGRGARMTAEFIDETGSLELIWFRGIKWVREKLQANTEYVVFGKPSLFNRKFNMAHPEVEASANQQSKINASLQPMYNTSETAKNRGLDSKAICKLTKILVEQCEGSIQENLSDELLNVLKLIPREAAYVNIHHPENQQLLDRATLRLKFEELFYIQLSLLNLKLLRQEETSGIRFPSVGEYLNTFYKEKLPFELTNAQKRVVKEIRSDLGSGNQMNRLLQGDVGSGKTLVALMSMLISLDNDCQTCLMAPTEILAQQHYETITGMLKGMSVQVRLLTGSSKTAERKDVLAALEVGQIHILIGTHALIEDRVKFKNLGLIVIDEQHRFGVAQRARLWKKNKIPPHVLVMTATPIPRTLAMTLYGDLDVSVIDELPPGRKAIKTYHFFDSKRMRVYGFMKEQIEAGRQIYVVFPLINESEKLDLKNLMEGYESIQNEFPLPKYTVSIVHGKLKPEEKELEMKKFVEKKTQIMVSTTVIEVGVDIPNASVMIIESAQRFGLSQLHQLRGRVGRGDNQSYCLLMTDDKLTHDGRKRVETMVRTTDGFEIAEADLKLRGPGDMEGTQQSGVLDLKIADIIKDDKMLQYARKKAIEILQEDPALEKQENFRIKKYYESLNKNKFDWGLIS